MVTRPRPLETIVGLVNGTQVQAMRLYKGGVENRAVGAKARLKLEVDPALSGSERAIVPASALETMAARPGDLVYVCDPRWWFGGLRSVHLQLGDTSDGDAVRVSPEAIESSHLHPGQLVTIEKII